MGTNTGETLQERSKGKDVRTSNIVAAKVRLGLGERCLWYLAVSRLEARLEAGRILLAFSNFGQKGAWSGGRTTVLDGGWYRRPFALPL